ncbi:MAG: hypothetical protein HYX67_12740 [Candidatus Melainabacteria bacterium]|nr:hypothetical protein [Candidatus Melainabacteria bacterium]
MISDRGTGRFESPAHGDSAAAHESVLAYQHTQVSFYKSIFPNTATPDSAKSNCQLNHEISNPPPIYGPQDTTSGAIGDLQKGIKSDSRTRHDLSNAIGRAIVGDTDGAMQYLRQASGDLNDAGGKIDSGLSKLGDGGQSHGSRTIQRGMVNEADCTENIQKAEKLLREGDTDGAIKAMSKGIREVAHRQHQTRDGIASLQGDDNGIDWQNFGPQNSSYDNRVGSNNSQGSSDTSFYPGYNQGDSNFDSQQHIIRSNNGGWNSTQPFTPDDSGSYQPYAPGGDYNGNYGPMQQPSDSHNGLSLSMNLPNPFDLARDLGLPTPPNPSDILNSLPNPFDMLSGSGGGLPNPFNIFGGGNESDSGSADSWPNPAKGLGDIMKNPAKPIENLLTPPKSPKDLVHKILDPIGIFG